MVLLYQVRPLVEVVRVVEAEVVVAAAGAGAAWAMAQATDHSQEATP